MDQPWGVDVATRRLYAGVVLIGIAVSLAVGPGVAAATPSDSSSSSDSPTSDSPSSESSPSSDSSQPSVSPKRDGAGASAGVADTDATREPDDEAGETDETSETGDVDEIEQSDESDTAAVATPTDSAGAGSTREPRKSPEPVTSDEQPAAEEPNGAVEHTWSGPAATGESHEVVPAAPTPQPVMRELAMPALADSAPTLRTLVAARPVTVDTIVTDVLTWVGLARLADGLPVPATPVSALVQSLWLAVRQSQYILNNQRPTAEATTSGPGPDGVVTGSLNAVDYDDTALTYTVAAAPEHGTVVVDAFGHFTYTPDAETALRGDRFTIVIDDSVGNPFHVHGLLGLLGVTGPTRVTIVVDAPSPSRIDDLATLDLVEVLSRDGVEVTTDSRGGVAVISGRFTDRVVTTAADAAAVMNAVAPTLGAALGFVDAAAITATRAGVGNSLEKFYRFGESIGGIQVLGSDVVLVTDADGAVTGLFNNYRGLAEGFDVTPADTVDEDSEIRLIAGTAYLGSGAYGDTLETLLTRSTFTSELVVHALDDLVAPSLAWRVVLQLPDTGDMTPSGTTYLIHADGINAGDVIVSLTNGQDAAVVSVATDWLGEQRSITVESNRVFFFTNLTMSDSTRNITTYRTSYSFFGLGGPVLPGTAVKRSWFTWDKGAVSAHANTAVVYDYFEDVLGRTSFDGAGALIEVSIRYNPRTSVGGYANAFWDPTRQQFGYGDSGYLQAALDVVGHEFTHAVVSYVVGDGGSVLDYGEPGALNEAYADILGALIEGKAGADRWRFGEDSDYGVVRNLADPRSVTTAYGPYRDHYATRYTGSGDDGGEHVNSTIFGHAAYRMMTAAATSGVSDETWARVFYHSLYRLSPGAVFTDGRAAVLSAATALGFTGPQLGAIADAFDSVGILGAAASFGIAA
ncbi:M4 family metallopeptidase [Mycolicibacterium hippocampi]|uniref:M4 family metallopeptidase n=1 Tax=Mycobacteriaceae TaxID=1762 RepID=UPI0015B5B27C|nr:M4 family metallopeptidase [Mycolicibacterium hippocampi]